MTVFTQPPGYYRIASAHILERFSFYGVMSILYIALTNDLQFSAVEASAITTGMRTISLYALVFGGLFSDLALRKRRPLFLASILMAISCVLISAASLSSIKIMIYLGLALLLAGSAIFRAMLYVKTADLFKENDVVRLTLGILILYILSNIGGFFAPIICAVVGQKIILAVGFLTAGLGALGAGALVKNIDKPDSHSKGGSSINFSLIVVILIAGLVLNLAEHFGENLRQSLDGILENLAHILGGLLAPACWLVMHRLLKGSDALKWISTSILALATASAIFAGLYFMPGTAKPEISSIIFVIVLVPLYALADALLFSKGILVTPNKFRGTFSGGYITLTHTAGFLTGVVSVSDFKLALAPFAFSLIALGLLAANRKKFT